MKPALLFLSVLSALGILARAQNPLAASDSYRLWAVSNWGTATVGNETLRASTWGESADPDRDGLTNLQEYAFGTHETTQPVTWSTTVAPGHFTLTYSSRTGDPAPLIISVPTAP